MQTGELFLSFNEKVIFALRSLYASRGFSQYKMSHFEEYDLYARNKDFLISNSVITFTDLGGKLMALKPDVTLSIIKNIKDAPKDVQKVFYNENVYRVSKGSDTYKEIMQAGLECFGDIDAFQTCEVISLALESLKIISNSAVLDISNLKFLENIFDSFSVPEFARPEIIKLIGEKNTHELTSLCAKLGLGDETAEILKLLISTSGKPEKVLPKLEKALSGKADITPLTELKELCASVSDELKPMLRIDFSVVSDMNYYSGIVFKGFIEGIPSSLLSGGEYNKLMQKMGRKSSAIGFAVYLDLLERFKVETRDYDIDVLVLFSENSSVKNLNTYINTLTNDGKTVLASKVLPADIKYREVVNFDSEVTL